MFHGNDKNSRLDYNKVADSFMRRVQSSYLQNLQSTKSSPVVNDASKSGETPLDVVKDDDVVKKIVDNPQITTVSTDIGVNQGDDDQQQYRQINDDTEQFMVEENDDNKELNMNDLNGNNETLNFDKLGDNIAETETEDKVSYGDNLSFSTGPEDVVYDYQQPGEDDQYRENIDDDYYENYDDYPDYPDELQDLSGPPKKFAKCYNSYGTQKTVHYPKVCMYIFLQYLG